MNLPTWVEPTNPWLRPLAGRLRGFFLPARLVALPAPPGVEPSLIQACEQVLTALLRSSGVLGIVALLMVAPLLIGQGRLLQLAFVFGVIVALLLLGLLRRGAYPLRAGAFLLCLYSLALVDLAVLGTSAEVYAYLIGFCFFASIYFSYRPWIGLSALGLSLVTLASSGALVSSGAFVPQFGARDPMSMQLQLIRALVFLLIVGTGQAGVNGLLSALRYAWQREREARERLETRVAERTHDLAAAHALALEQRQHEAQQKEYLAALHQTTLELLCQRDVGLLLHMLAVRASAILDAPFALIVLEQAGELLVMARTSNQLSPIGTPAVRGRAVQTWRCYESQQPVVTDDYLAQENRNQEFDPLGFRAILNVPIVAGARCLGVLSFTRLTPEHSFSPTEIEAAQTFARLAAVVIDNANLYEAAQRELAVRERAEGELKRYADALELQNSELDAFAHTVAHDLKSPLTTIIGYAELLTDSYDLFERREVADFLGTITRMGHKMTRIVNELLLLASVRSGEQAPRDLLALDQIMIDLDIRLAQEVLSSQATIVRPERWPAALGYAPWVEEVLANYLSNALKYGGRPPRITVGAEPAEGGQVCIWVADNGPGLSAEEQAQLFTPFTRLRARRADGHGLGLSIVQRIVQRLGGSVGVESQPGQGSRFFFTLPAAPIKSENSAPHRLLPSP